MPAPRPASWTARPDGSGACATGAWSTGACTPRRPTPSGPLRTPARPEQVVHLLLLAHDHVLEPVLHGLRRGLAAGRLDGRLEGLERLPLALDQGVERLGRIPRERDRRDRRGGLAAERGDLLDEPRGVLQLGKRVLAHLLRVGLVLE